ncbi:MAG: restriction endonuclease [Eubacteriales bacterium]|nr:restriction endonuclease [Eubacteriales bacterium]
MDFEYYGKNVTEAINSALKTLNVNASDIEYEVLDKGGLFRKARIRARIKEKPPVQIEKPTDVASTETEMFPVQTETEAKIEVTQPETAQGFNRYYSPYQGVGNLDEYVNNGVDIADIENQEYVNVALNGFQFFDSFDERFISGKLYYKDNVFVCITDDGSKTFSSVMPFKFMNVKSDYYYQKKVIDIDGSIYHFADDYEESLFLRYVKAYNEFVKSMIPVAQQKCEEIFGELVQNPEIPNAIQNFLDMIPEVLFVDCELYRTLLHQFCFRDEITKDYLKFSEYETENAISVLLRDGNQGAFQELWGLVANLQNLIGENFNVDDNFVNLVSYLLINYGLIQRYSKIWEENYNAALDVIEWESYVRECYTDNCLMAEDYRGITALTYALLKGDKFETTGYRFKYDAVVQELINAVSSKQKEDFAKALFSERSQSATDKKRITLEDVDLMSGSEFESVVCELFKKMGYAAFVTKASGDQGVDVIAEKNGVKIGIQAKCYSNTVGNSAIQEVVAGKKFYTCNRILVVTNNYYTKSAIELAAANGVTLWNRDVLSEKMNAYL